MIFDVKQMSISVRYKPWGNVLLGVVSTSPDDAGFQYELTAGNRGRIIDGWQTIQGALSALIKDLQDDKRGEFDFELKSPAADYAKRAGQTMASVVVASRKGSDDMARMLAIVAMPETELAALFAHAYELGYKHGKETP